MEGSSVKKLEYGCINFSFEPIFDEYGEGEEV